MSEIKPFKTCPNCGFVWKKRDDYLVDSTINIKGYQVNFQKLAVGLFLFNHSCGTTMAIPAGDFSDFYQGPFFTDQLFGSEECNEYCMNEHELRPCPAECECAAVREVLQVVSNWPKE